MGVMTSIFTNVNIAHASKLHGACSIGHQPLLSTFLIIRSSIVVLLRQDADVNPAETKTGAQKKKKNSKKKNKKGGRTKKEASGSPVKKVPSFDVLKKKAGCPY